MQLPFIRLFERKADNLYLLSPAKIERLFGNFIPEAAMDMLIVCLQGHSLDCRVVNKRSTKAGDFRQPRNGQPSRITVNGDLNRYAFLLTLIHEIAHFFVYLDTEKANTFLIRKHRPLPHGKEWKKRFTGLIQPFLSMNVFPLEVEKALVSYFEAPKASASADSRLQRLLQAYDPPGEFIRITDIPEGGLFMTGSGRVFVKMDRLRKRYRCRCYKSRKMYLFSPEAMILPVKSEREEKYCNSSG
ncbi:MAG: sprT domain-containing protein [Bacteroidota bacterium]